MMRAGWQDKEAGPVLGLEPGPRGDYPKTSQSYRPARRKIALLLEANWEKTVADLLAEIQLIREEREQARFNEELAEREARLNGRRFPSRMAAT